MVELTGAKDKCRVFAGEAPCQGPAQSEAEGREGCMPTNAAGAATAAREPVAAISRCRVRPGSRSRIPCGATKADHSVRSMRITDELRAELADESSILALMPGQPAPLSGERWRWNNATDGRPRAL